MMTSVPSVKAIDLRRMGRSPPASFCTELADGSRLDVVRLLRVLPGKRVVGEGLWQGRRVLAKLFVAPGSERHGGAEVRGLEALAAAGIPSPALLCGQGFGDGGHLVLSEFIDGAQTLAECWQQRSQQFPAGAPGEPAHAALLRPALRLLGTMHAAGLLHTDLHLGNFLQGEKTLYLIDGDAVQRFAVDAPGAPVMARANLALLLAQLPADWDACQADLVAFYCAAQSRFVPDAAALAADLARARAVRLREYLAKTVRECTQFVVRESAWGFSSLLRAEQETLAALVRAPDEAIARGQLLKDGRTCTVARVEAGGRALVVKRYNLKGLRHALSRCWRVSRAWQSWRSAHRLDCLGLATPRPLALLEERVGPLRRRAFLITEFCPGTSLLQHLSADRPPPAAEAAALVALFAALRRQRITHGDLKASNLLWHAGQLVVIDLDAMIAHRSQAAFARAWRRDRGRFLRNWPASSPLYGWLDAHLPPV